MFRVLAKAWSIPDLRRRILITLGIVAIYRALIRLPLPTFTAEELDILYASTIGQREIFQVANLFTGGALQAFSVVGLSFFPYLEAKGLVENLSPIIPVLEELPRQGQVGRDKLKRITYYVTILMAMIQAVLGEYVLLPKMGITLRDPILSISTILTLTAGAMFVLWLSDLITEDGIGNGLNILIYVNLLSAALALTSKWAGLGVVQIVITLVVMVVLIVLAVIMQEGQRRIPIKYGKRVRGTKMYGGSATYLPIKLIPVQEDPLNFVFGLAPLIGLIGLGVEALFPAVTFDVDGLPPLIKAAVVGILVFAFTFILLGTEGKAEELAENLQRNGGFIPDVRPGKKTAEHIDWIMKRLALAGGSYLGLLAALPWLLMLIPGFAEPVFALLAVRSIVSVPVDTIRQIEAQLTMRNYESFMG